MKISHSVSVPASLPRAAPAWEGTLRYAAAYLCTLIAILAAQLVIRNEIAIVLAALTLLGWPLSLWLRRNRLVVGGTRLPRAVVNGALMFLTFVVSLWIFVSTAPSLFSGDLSQYFANAGATQLVSLLMQAFLTFAACRCLAIINDKDAVLCTVPSFSVLLLLIVVHKGPEVVAYFLIWALVSAVLFALDHRRELRRHIAGRVPWVVPGQEARLSARGLIGVMSFSLLAAIGLSYGLSRENPEDPMGQGWVQALLMNLSQVALDLPDVSVNAGPERQIDFSSGPSLPTRSPLWQVTPLRISDGKPLRPRYWRMFTFAAYDGKTWVQAATNGVSVSIEKLEPARFPWPPSFFFGRRFAMRAQQRTPQQTLDGYDLSKAASPESSPRQFGVPRERVLLIVQPFVTNTGFLPTLPGSIALRLPQTNPETVRVRADNSVDMGVLRYQQPALVLSETPAQSEYGFDVAQPPMRRDQRPNPDVQLTAAERQMYLQLPAALPDRVRQWARGITARASSQDSDYARGRRLLTAIGDGAAYTLRPPAVPDDRDATDYFLFSSRRGYCTYFAGALTVACRAVGIPARVVSGFTNPEWQERQSSAAILRESGAHAWTEIWVPNWGWALLDPTPPDDRGDNAPSFGQNWQDLWGGIADVAGTWARDHRLLMLLGLAALGCLAAGFWSYSRRHDLRSRWLRRGLSSREDDALARRAIAGFYRRATRRAARCFRPQAPWETPYEWLREAESVLLLRDPSPLRRLTELYTQARYSPRPLGIDEVQAAHDAAKSLSWERTKS